MTIKAPVKARYEFPVHFGAESEVVVEDATGSIIEVERLVADYNELAERARELEQQVRELRGENGSGQTE